MNDIVLFIVDDMDANGYDVLGPAMDAIGGTRFDNYTCNTPLCCPSRATFLTGQLAHNSGVKQNKHGGTRFPQLQHDTVNVALQNAGYYTAMVGKFLNAYDGVAPGWDFWRRQSKGYWDNGSYTTHVTTENAIDAVASTPVSSPMFLWCSYYAPHAPWEPEAAYADADLGPMLDDSDRERKRCLLSVNDSILAIADAMGSRWDDASIIFVTDNGYLIGQHGTTGKSHWWNEATRVPAIFRNCYEDGTHPDSLVSTVDVPATILDITETALQRPTDGRCVGNGIYRDFVLVESWDEVSSGNPRKPFDALKGDDWIYVRTRDGDKKFFETWNDESVNVWETLDQQARSEYNEALDGAVNAGPGGYP